jgi:hypothetical protein
MILLRRTMAAIIPGNPKNRNGANMNEVWRTKGGLRRVRRDPPTLEEAVQAARGLSGDLQEQVEIAAALMNVPRDAVMAAAVRMTQRKDVNRVMFAATRSGGQRAVVVERRAPRRLPQRQTLGR